MEAKRTIETGRQPRSAAIYIILALIIIVAMGLWAYYNFEKAKYSGWMTGLVAENNENSILVAYQPLTYETKRFLRLPGVRANNYSDNYGAISPDGKYAAYTQWNKQGKIQYMVVNKIGTKNYTKYFDKDHSKPGLDYRHEVKYLSWFPDGWHLAFVGRDVSEGTDFRNDIQTIYVLDTKTQQIIPLVKGGTWIGETFQEKERKWVFETSPQEIDKLVKKYGGQKLSRYDFTSFLWAELSVPAVSPDGTMLCFTAI
jgi:hypothetical protein